MLPLVDSFDFPSPEIEVVETGITGCYELRPSLLCDARGYFAKLYHRPLWRKLGLCTEFNEEYITYSTRGVIRGLHFQAPPMQHEKVVICLKGSALDAAVDLRKGSPTFGQWTTVMLDSRSANAMYLPQGLAHGFCVVGSEALLYYKLSNVYAPAYDLGIRWNSAGVPWPIDDPIFSDRDRLLPALEDFTSPFMFTTS